MLRSSSYKMKKTREKKRDRKIERKRASAPDASTDGRAATESYSLQPSVMEVPSDFSSASRNYFLHSVPFPLRFREQMNNEVGTGERWRKLTKQGRVGIRFSKKESDRFPCEGNEQFTEVRILLRQTFHTLTKRDDEHTKKGWLFRSFDVSTNKKISPNPKVH